MNNTAQVYSNNGVKRVAGRYLDRDLLTESTRPYRIYDATKKRFLLWYWYKLKVQAMRGAYWIVRWLPAGSTLEVIDVRTMKLHASYTHHANGSVTMANESAASVQLNIKEQKD